MINKHIFFKYGKKKIKFEHGLQGTDKDKQELFPYLFYYYKYYYELQIVFEGYYYGNLRCFLFLDWQAKKCFFKKEIC